MSENGLGSQASLSGRVAGPIDKISSGGAFTYRVGNPGPPGGTPEFDEEDQLVLPDINSNKNSQSTKDARKNNNNYLSHKASESIGNPFDN
jgi:hypothetical protein